MVGAQQTLLLLPLVETLQLLLSQQLSRHLKSEALKHKRTSLKLVKYLQRTLQFVTEMKTYCFMGELWSNVLACVHATLFTHSTIFTQLPKPHSKYSISRM